MKNNCYPESFARGIFQKFVRNHPVGWKKASELYTFDPEDIIEVIMFASPSAFNRWAKFKNVVKIIETFYEHQEKTPGRSVKHWNDNTWRRKIYQCLPDWQKKAIQDYYGTNDEKIRQMLSTFDGYFED